MAMTVVMAERAMAETRWLRHVARTTHTVTASRTGTGPVPRPLLRRRTAHLRLRPLPSRAPARPLRPLCQLLPSQLDASCLQATTSLQAATSLHGSSLQAATSLQAARSLQASRLQAANGIQARRLQAASSIQARSLQAASSRQATPRIETLQVGP